MMSTMPAPMHQFIRHPALPWAELRISQQSPHCYRLHMHAEYSLGMVDTGTGLFQHPGGTEPLAPGDVVLIEPGTWHACNPQQPSHWSYRMVYVQADWLHQHCMADSGPLGFVRRAVRDAASRTALQALCQAVQAGDASGAAAPLRQLLLQHAQPAVLPLAADDAAVRQALHCLHQHPESAPSVQALAQACSMSASRFIRHFKAATGVTPGAYRLNLRLNGARHLLAQGAALAQAAHAMGFADQAHLQRSFKAHHALTPGRYAQGSRENEPAEPSTGAAFQQKPLTRTFSAH